MPESLRRIHRGEIRIAGREGGYLGRFLERLSEAQQPEHVKAFIRLTAFEPEEVIGKSWFENFYNTLDEAVRNGKLRIEYIFLLRTETPEGWVKEFISRYKDFAEKIAYVSQKDPRLTSDNLRPSIVLFETQQIAFTHDRGDDGTLLEATEWVSQENYRQLNAQFSGIELMSTTFFRNEKHAKAISTLS